MESKKINEKIDFFKSLTLFLGKDKNDSNKEANYSISWFYNNYKFKEGSLAYAFLSKDNSLKRIKKTEIKYPKEIFKKFFSGTEIIDKYQIDAIYKALNNRITIIQGPPGNGKTQTIINLVSCITTLKKENTVAIVSCNNAAIENIEEKLKKSELDGKYAFLGNKEKRSKFNDEEFFFEKCPSKEYTSITKQVFKGENGITAENFTKKYNIITNTINSLFLSFSDSMEYQYDYVIIDEASQVSIELGLMAMCAAKNIVLVGDKEQLPPIVNNSELTQFYNENKQQKKTGKNYYSKEGCSFLDACTKTFNNIPNILLKNHYRCQPKIIEFCNLYVYKKQLKIKSKDNGKCPFMVKYFNGNYCEKYKKQGIDWESKTNFKQIRIFIEEELENIKKLANEKKSICILSPFRGLIYDLKDIIVANGITLDQNDDKEDSNSNVINNINALTIHKAQGLEFDIVYFLPVEDNVWEYPWSQKKRMINVAVSRAREKLVIITSTELMPKNIRKKLMGNDYYEKDDIGKSNNNLFVQKLIRYIYNTKGLGEKCFVKSNITSIFDNIPKLSQLQKSKCSLGEQIFKNEIDKLGLIYQQNVSITDILTNPKSYDFHFDFFFQNKKIAVEIDGEQHRTNQFTVNNVTKHLDKDNDKTKDKMAIENKIELFRFPTNGAKPFYVNGNKEISEDELLKLLTEK